MSCHIDSIGRINDTEEIKKKLFLTDDEKDSVSESWIQRCLVSVSPAGDIIVLGNERKIVKLTSKWDSTTSTNIFQITYSGTLPDDIKSILCVPIVVQSKSSNIQPDWTCTLVGFESGYVRAYSDTFELIYEEQFHNESVMSLKCQSQHSPRSDIAMLMKMEEIYVQYETILCIINGKQFIPILRKNRAQLARAQANTEGPEYSKPVLEVRKWEFQDQTIIKDVAVIGLSISNTFDNLLAISTCDGFDSHFRSEPSNHTLVLAVGWKPFLGFHFATEGTNQAILNDVAKFVAYKLKSALPSWLTGNAQSEKNASPVQHPAKPMGCRFGLCDLPRAANSIILSYDHNLAAISDSLGRVIIIDTKKGYAIKILKGYRDAQCSFVQVQDDRYSNQKKVDKKIALFLVVYSPKKGTIEIFTTQQFLKIATFSASKRSRLLYVNYSMFGFSQLTKSKYACQFTTVLLDEDGQIKEIVIPFHFALSEKSSKKGRDIYLYRKMREMVRSGEVNDNVLKSHLLNAISELQTEEMKIQFVELMLKPKNLTMETLLDCTKSIIKSLSEHGETEAVASFRIKANNIVSLLNFYVYMKSKEDHVETQDSSNILEEKDTSRLKEFLSNVLSKEQHMKVTFADENIVSIVESLSIFNLETDCRINLKTKYDENMAYTFCKDLFSKHVERSKNLNKFKEEVIKSNINTKDLFLLLIIYWVNHPMVNTENLDVEMNNFTNILYVLLKIALDDSPGNSLKYYWEDVREVIFNSIKPIPALIAAISCKNIAYKIEKDSEDSSSDLDFEVWSKENIEWSMLIGKLEDVSLLNILIIKKPIVSKYCSLPKLSHDTLDISLKFVLQQKGSVGELVARWITMSGIDPEMIALNEILRNKLSDISDEDELEKICPKEKRDFLETEKLFEDYNTIRTNWPYSLDAGIILANMSWEYALEWKKNLQNIDCLRACFACLKAIPNFFLKLGLFNLVWKTHLKLLFQNTINLVNKVGKVPKMKFCMQDTGLSDVLIPIFIQICSDYLDTFADLVQEMYNVPKTPLKFEPLWENGGQPLAELAIQQVDINYELLLVHYELSLVFNMLSQFAVKAKKPIQNLFDVEVISVFFTDFQEKPPIDFSRKDSVLTDARLTFLKKMISCSVESIPSNNGEPYFKEHNYWMSKCILLGTIWELNVDALRLHENIQYFVQGYDTIAHETMSAIDDKNTLGRELLKVAGRRIKNYMSKSPDIGTVHTYLTPAITGWIEKLNNDWCADSNLKDIYRLTRMALINTEVKKPEHELAKILFEAIEQLIPLLEE